MPRGDHLVGGQFKLDKYEWCPIGFVPLKIKDKAAQKHLWEYAQDIREKSPAFALDLMQALKNEGYRDKEPKNA